MAQDKDLNDNPAYYELVYSFRNAASEVQAIQRCIELYSEIPVRKVLELCCGPCALMREIVRRGYAYAGVDDSERMLAYARRKASRYGDKVSLLRADLRDFSLEPAADFAFTSFSRMRPESFEDALLHMESVARSLNVGGLYLMDWCVTFHWEEIPPRELSWKVETLGRRLEVSMVAEEALQHASHLFRRNVRVVVNEGGKQQILTGSDCLRVFLPAEFLRLLELTGAFEFVGWWNRTYLVGETVITRPISLVKRVPERKPRRTIALLAEKIEDLWRGQQ